VLTSDFDFDLPPELIASEPLPDRAASRMLVVHRSTGELEHRMFRELPAFVQPGDLFVFNNTRVVPARFYSPDGKREVLWLETLSHSPLRWRCMVRPGKKFRVGDAVEIGETTGRVIEFLPNGNRVIEWDKPVDWEKDGHLALPHYMKREAAERDRERYQTVYGQHDGSIAAPTAGLHFTPQMMTALPHAFVTLHVGVGTFQPVKAERIDEHVMHSERYSVPQSTVDAVAAAKRVITVGTTATRTLESVALKHGHVIADEGETDIFIHPGKSFRVAGAMVTNFHLPKSSLIMLVSAFAGRELILKAYNEAVRERYRFFSYGDCMLIV
jgi:S-adenosylmethionine:tRNA ribosyltransferase-isomerase